jgi:hypothetical protein
MFYLYSLGGIAVISDQRRATERVRHEPLLNISTPARETYRDPKQRIHNKTERHTHILQMLSLLAFVFTLLQIQICCSKANRTTRHPVRSRT